MVEGEAHGISVCFRDYPVREADDGSERIEVFPDFNVFLLDAIWEQIPDYDAFVTRACISPTTFYLRIRDCFPILVEVRVDKPRSKRQFMTEMPDAVIDAFRRSAIGR